MVAVVLAKRPDTDLPLLLRRPPPRKAALVGHMYAEGYGCRKDADKASYWIAAARRAGRDIDGVYDAR